MPTSRLSEVRVTPRTWPATRPNSGIEIYTISLGNDADLQLMQSIADIGSGRHFDATGAGVDVLAERLTAAFTQAAFSMKRVQLVR